jgi:GxxExxY protein
MIFVSMVTQKLIKEISHEIIGCAIEVNKSLGPGLLESVYDPCFRYELHRAGLNVQSQVHLPILYKEMDLGGFLKIDIIVNNLIIVEEKAVDIVLPIHKAQLITYLKLTDLPKGFLINFNSTNISNQMIAYVGSRFKVLEKE